VIYCPNNYQAGLIGGRYMGRWAGLHWSEDVPDVVLIGYSRAGSISQSRVKGVLAGFQETWKHAACRVVQLDSIGDFDSALHAVRSYLLSAPARKTLVGSVNDPAALAALRAFEEAGRGDLCAVMSQSADLLARAEMRRVGSKLIGSVAYFPEQYGPSIIGLARKVIGGLHPPPALFTKHRLVTPDNVDRLFPNDSLTLMSLEAVAH
jgi:ribose transport system substrate-binding protein